MKKNNRFKLFYRHFYLLPGNAPVKQMIRVMKIYVVLICLTLGELLATDIRAQSISLEMESKSLSEALAEIEQKTDYHFFYNTRLINVSRKVSIDVKNTELEVVLKQLLYNLNIDYKLVKNQIVLFPRGDTYVVKILEELLESAEEKKRSDKERAKEKILNETTTNLARAFQNLVTGNVTDQNGMPLPGVNIVVKGTQTGTQTDFDGNYSISANEGQVLVFSYVGQRTREVTVGPSGEVNVQMEEDAQALEEVVVVGYGTQERRELTGSITSINNESMQDLVTPSFDQQLAGRAPGVQVTNPGGVLGARPIIRIRGVNSLTSSANPLIVVDGVPMVDNDRSAIQSANSLSNINPADIESFEVLKDGSATAIYGSRAANGVILITTKRGKAGETQVSYNMNVGFNEDVDRFDLLNGDQFVTIANEKRTNAGQSELAAPGVNTDWQDHVLRTGFTQQHNLSLSGGNEQTKFFFSLGFMDQEAIVKPNDMKRYSFRSNVDHKIGDRINIGTSLSYSFTELNGLNQGANSLSGAIYNATRNLPNVPIYDPENTAYDGYNVTEDGQSTGWGNNLTGPDNNIPNIGFVIANNRYRSRTHRIIGNAFGELEIIEGLKARTQIGVDLTLNEDLRSWDPRHGDGNGPNGSMYMSYRPAQRWNWQNTLNYRKVIADHHILNVTAGAEYQKTSFYNFNASGTGFSDRFFMEENLISGSYANQFSGGQYEEIGFDSYFGRLNYSYQGKYMLSFSARNDGISSLPKDNRRGTFFGGSVGWRISDENFFNSGLITDLKIRGSYAEVGNTEIGAFPYAGGYAAVLGGIGAGIGYDNMSNRGLQWETSKKFNVGLDMTIANVNLNFDYFRNNISDLILDAPTIPSLGIPGNNISQNVGAMVNKGVELRLMTKLIDNGNFSWTTDFNFSFIENEVTEMNAPIITTYNITEEGGSVAQLYGYKWAGVNPENGNPMYYRNDDIIQYNLQKGDLAWKTYNPDNPGDVSTAAEGGPTQDYLGNTLPKWYGGWTNNFKYKNFDAELFVRYSGGNYIMNQSLAGLLGQGFSNNHKDILNRWTAPGQETDIPKLYSGQDSNMWQTSAANSRFVEKGDFLRVQNIAFGYSPTREWLNRAFSGAITSVRIFAQVQNPFVITGYSGLDPELNRYTSGTGADSPQLRMGVDWNVAPIIRTWSMGLNIGF
ncbi:TonB-dependent receptor [Sinomicrobium weinanense]|uniref:TonB-dependent receptor n=1 Tax=Sinomicrobium weinanense TaxID=2842200 RepID=A0A926Q369_9FLAO|nr:TonB-dependent receptor [Sinomicrobium weinanense]MBC9797317.1 TonB-dependent receptor [Sinomicrobium weinanense]MBU3122786.1 TonB-dependent receptor [Sinomicrobium weinanense]